MVAQPKVNASKPAKGGPTESGDRNTAAPEVEVLRREMGVGEGGEMGETSSNTVCFASFRNGVF